MGKIILGIFIGVGALVCLAIFWVSLTSSQSASPALGAETAAMSESPEISLSAAKLWSDYQENEVAADNAYKGKRLLVRGQVSGISKDFLDKTYLTLATPNEFMPVHANLRSEYVSAAAHIFRGQIVSAKCDGGGMIVGSPILNDCSLVQGQQGSIPRSSDSAEPSQAANPQDDQPPIVERKSSPSAPLPAGIAQLVAQEAVLNDRCRGGSGDDDATGKACAARDMIFKQIEAEGWCWGHDGQAEADRDWEPCPGSSAKTENP